MNRLFSNHRRRIGGFTLLELQVALVLLSFGVATLGSLMTTQRRLMTRLRGDLKPGATVCMTRTTDPWVKSLNLRARVSIDPLVQTAPPSFTVYNSVTIISKASDPKAETLTVSADVAEIPQERHAATDVGQFEDSAPRRIHAAGASRRGHAGRVVDHVHGQCIALVHKIG